MNFPCSIWALDDGMILNGREHQFQSIEAVAEHCYDCLAATLVSLQRQSLSKESPTTKTFSIFLGGWSYGGVVASELAKYIQMRNKSVGVTINVLNLILFDAPLRSRVVNGATSDPKDDDAVDVLSEERESVGLDDVSNRHFRACTKLLEAYHIRPKSSDAGALSCPVWDFRPRETQCDCDIEAAAELVTTPEYVTRRVVDGSHWTMLFDKNGLQVADIVSNLLKSAV